MPKRKLGQIIPATPTNSDHGKENTGQAGTTPGASTAEEQFQSPALHKRFKVQGPTNRSLLEAFNAAAGPQAEEEVVQGRGEQVLPGLPDAGRDELQLVDPHQGPATPLQTDRFQEGGHGTPASAIRGNPSAIFATTTTVTRAHGATLDALRALGVDPHGSHMATTNGAGR